MVFKSVAISKVGHLLLITKLHNNTIDLMNKIQKNFIWQGKKAKIKHSTLCNGYENGGLKTLDIRNKITSIQCSWIKRLFEDDFHDGKVITPFLIGKHLGKKFKFHNNIDLSKDILLKFLSIYQNIFIKLIINYTDKPTLPSMILYEFIWFNSNIKVGSRPVQPTAQDYFENLFESSDFNWKKIYFLIRNTTLDTKACMFQYKVLHNTLYVNKILFKFGKGFSPECSFCKLHEETMIQLFYDCLIVKRIWN